MKLGLVANYTHSISNVSSNIDYSSQDLLLKNNNHQPLISNPPSIDFSNNYMNFMTNKYQANQMNHNNIFRNINNSSRQFFNDYNRMVRILHCTNFP